MNWSKLILAGVVAGVVIWLADFALHGLIMGATYMKYPVFTQQAASPFTFLLVSLCIALTAALFYAKSYGSWGGGWKGGATFGFFLGLAAFFTNFYPPIVIEGFPYFLAWCWGGINVIEGVIGGAVLGLIYKP